jgi:predicted alternative tryptophan synthase beta-subunit
MAVTPLSVAERSEAVAPKLREYLPITPFERFGAFSDELGAEVLVKCEHRQVTGSFKARGAMAKILALTDEQRERGVVTASTGNHGLGVGNALATLGGRGIVYLRCVGWVWNYGLRATMPAYRKRRPGRMPRSTTWRTYLLTTTRTSLPGRARSGWRSSRSWVARDSMRWSSRSVVVG